MRAGIYHDWWQERERAPTRGPDTHGPVDDQSAARSSVNTDELLQTPGMRFRRHRWPVVIMLSRCHGVFIVLCVGLEVSRISSTENGIRCTLNSVGLMLLLPEKTHQWSLLGLNLWSNRGANKAGHNSNEQDINQWSSRGESNETNVKCCETSPERESFYSEEKTFKIYMTLHYYWIMTRRRL